MEKIIVFKDPTSPVAEAYRILCTNLLAGRGEKGIIELAGVTGGENASLVVANLAVVMAQVGKKVLIMDCNLRTPGQHTIFAVADSGLTDCLESSQNVNGFIQATAQANLFVLSAGAVTTNPVETLLGQPMQELLDTVKEQYDIVFLDVPPAVAVADAAALGSKADGVVLVLSNKTDKVEDALKVKEIFTQAGVRIIGCVLDKA